MNGGTFEIITFVAGANSGGSSSEKSFHPQAVFNNLVNQNFCVKKNNYGFIHSRSRKYIFITYLLTNREQNIFDRNTSLCHTPEPMTER